MNTERPDNDDVAADGSAEEQGAREHKGAAGTEASGVTDVEASGVADGDTGASDTGTEQAAVDEPSAADEQAAADEPSAADQHAAADEGTGPERAAVGEQAGGVEVGDATPAPEEAGADGSARRRSPAIIASVAAAVLLVGGGGAYLAANAAGGSGGGTASGATGGDTPPPLHLDGYSEGGTNGIAPGEPNPYGATYRADGELPDGPGSAPVYRAGGEVGADEVARLAKALGMDGKPVAQGQTWKVGAKDGAGPSLQVNKRAPGTWTFYRYAPGTDDCESTTVCAKKPGGQAGDPVSEEAAKKAAAPVLKAVGQDDAKLDASQLMGAQRVVNADPVVGGLPTYGWTTGVTVSAQGEVVGGSGQLKAPVKGATYPVLDAEKTLGLVNAAPGAGHRMGIGGCASPVPLKDRLEAPCGSEASAGAPKKETITVEKAVFGLAAHYVDARQALVPSWLFEVRAPGAKDSFTVTHPAIDPKYLVSSTPSEEPPAQPSPRPTGPKDEPTAAPVTRNVAVDGYTADGRELTVAFTGGVCADYKVTASESGEEVTVRVTETSQPEKVCILIAKVFHKTVQLDEPLGDRKVVGTDGQEVPLEKPGARLPDAPQSSGAR
ncbi:hypothetical protein [Streptomyces curacoi]|uniref:Large membrane protein n=1 Tax=Streptomyces curacoi TaxID=146536 RepID=A0A117PMA0_9ACTN|nr:hypothetical protein [Streptomyces curacoi]KUM82161.1 hypothetical protein AQI70_02310 [Streptomyces curacoi]